MRHPSEDHEDETQPLPVRRRKDPIHEYVEHGSLPHSPALLEKFSVYLFITVHYFYKKVVVLR